MRTEAACHALSKQLVDKKRTLIAFGSWRIAANSPIRGHVRPGHTQLLKALRVHADVILTDEFRTSKLCSNCHAILRTSRLPHRYQFCPECGSMWNRDVNAGNNIIYVALCALRNEPLHRNFIRENPHRPLN